MINRIIKEIFYFEKQSIFKYNNSRHYVSIIYLISQFDLQFTFVKIIKNLMTIGELTPIKAIIVMKSILRIIKKNGLTFELTKLIRENFLISKSPLMNLIMKAKKEIGDHLIFKNNYNYNENKNINNLNNSNITTKKLKKRIKNENDNQEVNNTEKSININYNEKQKNYLRFIRLLTQLIPHVIINPIETIPIVIHNTTHIDLKLSINSKLALQRLINHDVSVSGFITSQYADFMKLISFGNHSKTITRILRSLNQIHSLWKQNLKLNREDLDIKKLNLLQFSTNNKLEQLKLGLDLPKLEGITLIFLDTLSSKIRKRTWKLVKNLHEVYTESSKNEKKKKHKKITVSLYQLFCLGTSKGFGILRSLMSQLILPINILSKDKLINKKLKPFVFENQLISDFNLYNVEKKMSKNKANQSRLKLKKKNNNFENFLISDINQSILPLPKQFHQIINNNNLKFNQILNNDYLLSILENTITETAIGQSSLAHIRWTHVITSTIHLATMNNRSYLARGAFGYGWLLLQQIGFPIASIQNKKKTNSNKKSKFKKKISKQKNSKKEIKNKQRNSIKGNRQVDKNDEDDNESDDDRSDGDDSEEDDDEGSFIIDDKLILWRNITSIVSSCCDPEVVTKREIIDFLDYMKKYLSNKRGNKLIKRFVKYSLSRIHPKGFLLMFDYFEKEYQSAFNKKYLKKNLKFLFIFTAVYRQFVESVDLNWLKKKPEIMSKMFQYLLQIFELIQRKEIIRSYLSVKFRYNFFSLLRFYISFSVGNYTIPLEKKKYIFHHLLLYSGITSLSIMKRKDDIKDFIKTNKEKKKIQKKTKQELVIMTDSIEFLVNQCLSYLLYGKLWNTDNLKNNNYIFQWIKKLINYNIGNHNIHLINNDKSHDYKKELHEIGINSLNLLFQNNPRLFIKYYLEESYNLNPGYSMGFIISICDALIRNPKLLDEHLIINFIMYNYIHENKQVRIKILELWKTLVNDISKIGNEEIKMQYINQISKYEKIGPPKVNSRFCDLPEKFFEERSMINSWLSVKRPDLAFSVFKNNKNRYWKLTILKERLLNGNEENNDDNQEIINRIKIETINKKRESLLKSIIPWIKNISYDRENFSSKKEFQHIFIFLLKITIKNHLNDIMLSIKLWGSLTNQGKNTYGILKFLLINGIGRIKPSYLQSSKEISLFLSKTSKKSIVQILLNSKYLQIFTNKSQANSILIYNNVNYDENDNNNLNDDDDHHHHHHHQYLHRHDHTHKKKGKYSRSVDDELLLLHKLNQVKEPNKDIFNNLKNKKLLLLGKEKGGNQNINNFNQYNNLEDNNLNELLNNYGSDSEDEIIKIINNSTKNNNPNDNKKKKNRSVRNKIIMVNEMEINRDHPIDDYNNSNDISNKFVTRSDFVVMMLSNLVYVSINEFYERLPIILHITFLGIDHKIGLIRSESKLLLSNILINFVLNNKKNLEKNLHNNQVIELSMKAAKQLLINIDYPSRSRLWPYERVTKSNFNIPSELIIQGFIKKIIIALSCFEPNIRRKWFEEARDWIIWKDNNYVNEKQLNVISRSFQIYRYLLIEVTEYDLFELLYTLRKTLAKVPETQPWFSWILIEQIKTIRLLAHSIKSITIHPKLFFAISYLLKSKHVKVFSIAIELFIKLIDLNLLEKSFIDLLVERQLNDSKLIKFPQFFWYPSFVIKGAKI
ncbi:hypothetical protein M0812_02100 [Anaeramoeba flamelloides]|uniref:Cell morphogenesis central region domain-containing protein n=1 Tax=Anaeramoeba flamelloides TaxID=1746091 RepID=A0AAV7Z432_9EUKA|nr:hypothetical protein M0812_02100 [Anaeramoeba flamelloides]